MPLSFHLEKLRHFVKLFEYRSINECARATGMSQAGLSKSISNLETALGAQLFVRSQEGLRLTPAGTLLLQTARRVMQEASEFEARLRSLGHAKLPKRLTFGMYDSLAVYFFPDFSEYFKTVYPGIELSLVVDRSSRLRELAERNKIDAAVGVNLGSGGPQSSCEYFALFEDHYSFYCSPNTQEQSANAPLLYHPESLDSKGRSVAQWLEPLIGSRNSHRIYNFETIKTLTMQGQGVGVLPSRVASRPLEKDRLVAIRFARMSQRFGRHSIGVLVGHSLLKGYPDFTDDIRRISQRWS